ncbi:MAG: phosphoribosylformylglycinamidine cyclo-ligase [Candidatus Neomarinimicrobiota bacterium]
MSPIDYKSSGVDIDAANEAVERIREQVKSTFTPHVLTDVGSFGAMVDADVILKNYRHPVLVQSIDGVGTKMIVARMMNKYDTIGMDLVSATCNDIIVHGARPLTFLDYIANDKLIPETVEKIVAGIAQACRETGVSLIGGETAEMPDTYLPGEHDLVGVITGVVDRERIVSGKEIRTGDAVLGLGSSGLHTNGYSLARKLFFDAGKFKVNSSHSALEKSVGETLLEPHLNYTQPILTLLEQGVPIRGMAHITGGGLVDNIPRILPQGCSVEISRGAWPEQPVFTLLTKLGQLHEKEAFRTFNMGIGMVVIVSPELTDRVRRFLLQFRHVPVYEIGKVVKGDREVRFV